MSAHPQYIQRGYATMQVYPALEYQYASIAQYAQLWYASMPVYPSILKFGMLVYQYTPVYLSMRYIIIDSNFAFLILKERSKRHSITYELNNY